MGRGYFSVYCLLLFPEKKLCCCFTTQQHPYWGEVLGYLMISFVAVSGTYIFGTLLTANNSMKRMNLIFLASIILNVLLNVWLIPSYKASGAAIATSLTQLFAMFAQVYLAIRLLDSGGFRCEFPCELLFSASV